MRNEEGFSLLEVMVAMLLAGLLMALGYSAFRGFWLNRGFEGARTTTVTELRHLQQSTVSESHPVVFGAMFQPGSAHTTQSGSWTVIRYDPADPVAKCRPLRTVDLGGAYVSAASFDPPPDTIATTCSGSGVGYGTAGKHFVFFFARGTATAGQITLKNDQLGKTSTVKVLGLTSRVEG